MAELKCSAHGCVYNKQEECHKDCVQVEGQSAKISEETCCKSFQDKESSMK